MGATAQNRLYSKGFKKSLNRVYANTCANCAKIVSGYDAHADHVVSYANGGSTSPGNAQLLCRECNLNKGASNGDHSAFHVNKPELKINLRPWQKECLDQQLAAIENGEGSFFTAAGVGSGKTVQALSLYLEGNFDMVIIITPRSGIRGSWMKDATAMGIDLKSIVQSSDFVGDGIRKLPNGYVLNVQMLTSVVNDVNILCARFNVLVVLDEAHHFGEDMTWTESVQAAFPKAAFTLAMSGTPYRGDGSKILILDYVKQGRQAIGAPDYIRSYESALAAGEVAPVVSRFVGGSITKEKTDGASEKFDYKDGDYSMLSGAPNAQLMSERLRLSAVESLDWQMAAVAEARRDLMSFRQDGQSWSGLIACKTIEQAKDIQKNIEFRWGDKCMLIVAEANTESCVEVFTQDTSFVWAISITKISEGVSIDRLRVLALLSNTTTRSNFEQLRGRIVRMMPGVSQLAQTAVMYIPADPRLIEYAMESNKLALHTVDWLDEKLSEEESVEIHDKETKSTGTTLTGDVIDVDQVTPDQINHLRLQLQQDKNQSTVNTGDYTLYAAPQMEGASVGEEFVSEDAFLSLRDEMAEIIHPLSAARASQNALAELRDIFKGK